MASNRPTLLQEVRRIARLHGLAEATEKAYVGWIRRFVRFHHPVHPRELQEEGMREFLVHLANERRLAPSSMNQARAALVFLYRKVYGLELERTDRVPSVRKPNVHPVVLDRREVRRILELMDGPEALLTALLYGGGLRRKEAVRLRVKDLDFAYCKVSVRDAKGGRNRFTLLPAHLVSPLESHLERVREIYDADRREGVPGVSLPWALKTKYARADVEWSWFWAFPSPKLSRDPKTGLVRRHHIHPDRLQRELRKAVRKAGIAKPVGCHTLRHTFATHLLENHHSIRTVQELLGHKNVKTTMVYTHVMRRGVAAATSPLDDLFQKG